MLATGCEAAKSLKTPFAVLSQSAMDPGGSRGIDDARPGSGARRFSAVLGER